MSSIQSVAGSSSSAAAAATGSNKRKREDDAAAAPVTKKVKTSFELTIADTLSCMPPELHSIVQSYLPPPPSFFA